MAIWKRKWTTRGKLNPETGEREPELREAWVLEYRAGDGRRHLETFQRKKDADARQAEVKVDVKAGTHVATSQSVTVAEAAAGWIRAGQAAGLERSTLDQYRQHVDQHLVPFIGKVKLSNLNAPTVRKLEDHLREKLRSPAMIRKIIGSLGSLLADAQEQGLAARNPVRDLRRNRKRGKDARADKRENGKLKIGVDIPSTHEVKAIIDNAKGRWRPLLLVAAFTGLRASELRGLRWADVDLKAGELHVRQRADRFNEIGKPKSHAGERTVPFGPIVTNTLKQWRLACPKGELDLVFPNGIGKIESLANIINRGLIPAQPGGAKYTGMHVFRHFYASWCIDRKLPPKVVQERLGHSSIIMTYDRYGHLFPRGDDAKEIADAEKALLA